MLQIHLSRVWIHLSELIETDYKPEYGLLHDALYQHLTNRSNKKHVLCLYSMYLILFTLYIEIYIDTYMFVPHMFHLTPRGIHDHLGCAYVVSAHRRVELLAPPQLRRAGSLATFEL